MKSDTDLYKKGQILFFVEQDAIALEKAGILEIVKKGNKKEK